jgi:hypothetical protein
MNPKSPIDSAEQFGPEFTAEGFITGRNPK